jgi:hypothetical protein
MGEPKKGLKDADMMEPHLVCQASRHSRLQSAVSLLPRHMPLQARKAAAGRNPPPGDRADDDGSDPKMTISKRSFTMA